MFSGKETGMNLTFKYLIEQAPVGIVILRGEEMIVDLANSFYLEMFDKQEAEFIDASILDSFPVYRTEMAEMLGSVLSSGQAYQDNEVKLELFRYGAHEICYFNYICKPLLEENAQRPSGLILVVTEVTEQVTAKLDLERSELQLRNLVMQSQFAKAVFMGPEFIITMANEAMVTKLWRRKMAEVQGHKLLEVFPELNDQIFPKILKQVFESGKIHRENEAIALIAAQDGLRTFYLDYQYAPLFENDGTVSGIMVSVSDVTEKVLYRNEISDAAERLSLATEGTKLATWDLNLRTFEILYSNRLPTIFGYPKHEILSHSKLRDHAHPDDLETIVMASFNKAMESGVYYYEARIIQPDNNIRWIRTHGKVLFDEQNKPFRMLGTMMDVTDAKETELAIITSEAKFRTLANAMPQFVWTADEKGNLFYFNQAVYQYSGLNEQDITGEDWLKIVHPDDREENIRKWKAAIRTGKDFQMEHRFRRYDGIFRWQLSRAIAQRDITGNINTWIGTSTDIHDRKIFIDELESKVLQRTEELTSMNDELTRTNMELAQFAYVASHDLQEPLRKIQTFASRILETEFDRLSEKGKDYFSRMRASSTRMQQLISDLIAFSGANSAERHFELVDMNVLMNRLLDQLKEEIEHSGTTILVEKLPELLVIPYQMEQLFMNLLVNSMKFTEKGVQPIVEIAVTNVSLETKTNLTLPINKSYYCFAVEDNGIGFEAEYRDRIFQVFQRLHNRDTYEGTGIGLAICKKIVDNHAGKIVAFSELGKGARFEIYLPYSME
mgnify:CR=1 FL=1